MSHLNSEIISHIQSLLDNDIITKKEYDMLIQRVEEKMNQPKYSSENATYTAVLTGFEPLYKDSVINALVKTFGFTERAANTLVDNVPSTIESEASIDKCLEYQKKLRFVGASVKINDKTGNDIDNNNSPLYNVYLTEISGNRHAVQQLLSVLAENNKIKIPDELPALIAEGLYKNEAIYIKKSFASIGCTIRGAKNYNAKEHNNYLRDRDLSLVDSLLIEEDAKIHCPKCKSTSITTGQRGVNWKLGIIGASKTVNRCANCGYMWTPNQM